MILRRAANRNELKGASPMKMSNTHNRFVYALWSPVYDIVLERFFASGRRDAMQAARLCDGETVCLVGIGTGADLRYLRPGIRATGIDLSEAMLAKARRKLPVHGCEVDLRVGDAQALPFEDGSFDVVFLNLVLSVVPDPALCFAEAVRVVRPGGRLVVFDKFLTDEAQPSLLRRAANVIATRLGTDINRRLTDMLAGQDCAVASDQPSLLGGMYRVLVLKRG
ncbi:MAG: class I SAM-dependent methyltransferase [Alphaproteobacteria bacterium]|nr:class I SAM-dependent methyltransferase [Alphaproteobacteria bacterium]